MDVGAGLYMYDVAVKTFTFAISSSDEFLFLTVNRRAIIRRYSRWAMRAFRKSRL